MLRKMTFAISLLTTASISQAAVQISQVPLFLSQSAPPLNMLVMSRDHTLYYEAYNDASDLDGDGVVDVGYKPDSIDYYGNFNSKVCYEYTGNTGAATTQAAAEGRFVPKSKAGGANGKICSSSTLWSGDFLNYLTTSRMDAMRRVLYGGQRTVDTNTQTILEAAYIPKDGHAWGKSYDRSRDTYNINDYAPALNNPSSGKRHLFAITTLQAEGSNTRTQLRVIKNTDWQIWDWVSRESTGGQGGEKCGSSGQTASNGQTGSKNCGTTTGYNVRVEACTGVSEGLRDENCKAYPNHGNPVYKPTGLLHDFGESEEMFFGLLTGSFQKNIAGGTLRRNISSFTEEVNPQTGIFTSANGIVANINRLKVIDFNNDNSPFYNGCNWNSAYHSNPIDYPGGNSADCSMWGNPVAEMMFETLRYFGGATAAHSAYDYGSGSSKDKTHSLAKPVWEPPYAAKENGGGGYQYCARPVMTVLSDINPSYDYKLPGSRHQAIATEATALSGFNVSTEVDTIGTSEGIHGNSYFIGQSNAGNANDAPSPKQIDSLSWARGLSPEEPSKRGTYYSAGVARYGALNKIAGNSSGKNEVMTYAVALASPLPQIRIPTGSGYVTVVPFAKSIKNNGVDINKFVPTNPIVDYYVEEIVNTGDANFNSTVNGGRPKAKFIINYEDQEVGSDHDMDAIAEYTVALQAGGAVQVDVSTNFKAGSTVQVMGYVISGTTKDGIYIEVQDTQKTNTFYPLNTPANRDPGFCEGKSSEWACQALPTATSRTFTPSPSSSTGEFLKDPLWYAAKYGMPKRNPATVEGDPDNYFLVTNATTLQSQLTKAFNDILQRNTSVTSPVVQGNTTEDGTYIYRTDFKADGWTGDVFKEKPVIQADGSSALEPVWRASEKLPAKGSRRILFAPHSGTGALENFTWPALEDREFASTNLQDALNKNTSGIIDNLGEARVKYIRDDNCGSACIGFRERKERLGDIINSSPALVEGAQYLPYRAETIDGGTGSYRNFQESIKNRKSMLYVGANDGMLHAFNSETGVEEFAFIPTAVVSNLNKLTDPQYGIDTGEENSTLHQYFVDGTPVVADVYFNNQWRTVLIGGLGAGGRAVFALDITNPEQPELLWEFSHADDPAMGVSIPQPTIARLHSGQWAALIPNGYNSSAGRPTLFALDIQTGEQIAKLMTPADPSAAEAGNGLSNIRTADMNSDGIVDYVYGGDQLGNLWRFDLYNVGQSNFKKCVTGCTGIKDQYRVSFGNKPLYVAKDATGQTLPITAAPTLLRHPSSIGHLVVVGTGRYLGFEDKNTPFKRESLYGIWDRQTSGSAANSTKELSRSDLQEQTLSAATMQIGDETRAVRLITENTVQWYKPNAEDTSDSSVDRWGWHLDLVTGSTSSGERMVNNMRTYGEGLIFSTVTPSSDPCSAGLDGFTYAINPSTGGRTPYNVFDFSGDGKINNEDSLNGDVVSGFENPAGGFTIHDGFLYSPDGKRIAVDHGDLARGRQSWHLIPPAE